MGFWPWFWTWTSLVVASLAVLAIIGKSLFNRSLEVLHQGARLAKPAQALFEALETKPVLNEVESDLLRPSGEVDAERAALLRAKSKKQAARQRRLITDLKHIDLNESRFTND